PNPASESVKFSWKGNNDALSLEIYQITGTKVIDQIVFSNRAVSIAHLENGVYLYKLLNGQQNLKTGKLIKR
ncbi:MAG TPA: T9SS type A sorting domain-containing protein, partial [Draconibacterium sp.]|nr:T9SS type A sorting domain-containing protein [Draconibacterium sp.]